MPTELVQRMLDTQAFLKIAAAELRRLAEQVPDILLELQHLAVQLEAEATDLAAAVADDGTKA